MHKVVGRTTQIPGIFNCGQIAISNLTGLTLEEVTEAIGHDGPTRTKDLSRVLNDFGFPCGEKLDPLCERPRYGLAKAAIPSIYSGKIKGRDWHWLAVVDFILIDGRRQKLAPNSRITSYLEVGGIV